MTIEPVDTDEKIFITERLAGIAWNEAYGGIIAQEQIDYMVEKFQTFDVIKERIGQGHQYFLLIYDGEYAGYFGVVPENDRLFLSKLYVLSGFHRKGIARNAIEFMKDLCSNVGSRSIYLNVNKGNVDSIKFYEAVGFINVGDIKMDIGSGFFMDDYVMELFL